MKRLFSMPTIVALLLSLCLSPAGTAENGPRPPLRLATTTSTENSGLLGHLLPAFEKAAGIPVYVIAVGTGKALRMGRDGDVDVVLVHSPAAEQAFVEAGYGVDRRSVMYNDFILVGPPGDPAQIHDSSSAADAMRRIATTHSTFVSRGDDSGTHKKERQLWKQVGIEPGGDWYREAGQGMGKVLQIAGELNGYTLTDRGTWLAIRGISYLEPLFEGDPALSNPYGIIAVNPALHPDINYAGARALIDWITSREGQRMIGEYRIGGQRLFTPSAEN
ncbi:MAG TPA: tungsten ABC transporter substrate-binding protein [Sedimenticola sp.]|nr:tungsten ABC transporter substrate-binding protein [Sedimenticola sp.]